MPRGVYPRTAEMNAKQRASHMGHTHTPETIAKMMGNQNGLGNEGSLQHGQARRDQETLTYHIWMGMNSRCHNPNSKNYPLYGGRGIKMRYASVLDIIADIGERPSADHCIHRLDSDGNYEVGNCCWMLRGEHSRLHNSERLG